MVRENRAAKLFAILNFLYRHCFRIEYWGWCWSREHWHDTLLKCDSFPQANRAACMVHRSKLISLNQCILIYYDILWYIMFSKDGPLAEKSAQDCGCFRDEQRACWGFIMFCQSWSWMVWEEYLMVQHLFDSLWISSKINCQDIDFCDGNVLRLSLKNKACSSATAHPQLLHVLNRIVAHFKLENPKKTFQSRTKAGFKWLAGQVWLCRGKPWGVSHLQPGQACGTEPQSCNHNQSH